jgi:hypothetical protein
MKKLLIITGVICAFFIVSGFNLVYSSGKGCPPGQERGRGKCIDLETGGDVNVTNSNTNSLGQTQGLTFNTTNAPANIDFDHVMTEINKTNAEFSDTPGDNAKIFGFYMGIKSITWDYAENMSKDTTDVKILTNLMFENDFQTLEIIEYTHSPSIVLMGTKTFSPTGKDITADGLFGLATFEGMKSGATHFLLIKATHGAYAEGSKAGIDFSTSASIASESDGSVLVSPGSSLGYSKAWSSNEYRPGMVMAYFFDPSLNTPIVIDVAPDKSLVYTPSER